MKKIITFNGNIVYAEFRKYSAYLMYGEEFIYIYPDEGYFSKSKNCPKWLVEMAFQIGQTFYDSTFGRLIV